MFIDSEFLKRFSASLEDVISMLAEFLI